MTQPQAEALLERENKAVNAYVEQQEQQQKQWIESIKADQEIGGEAFQKNAELAKRVVDRFGTDELRKELTDSGYGNHPGLVRLLVRIGKAMSEDSLVRSGSEGPGRKNPEDVLYPPTQPKE